MLDEIKRALSQPDREALVKRLREKLFDNPDFRNPGNPSYREGYEDGLNDMADEFKAALSAQGGEQSDTVSVPIPESQMKNGYFGLTLCFGSTSTRDKAHDMLATAKEGK